MPMKQPNIGQMKNLWEWCGFTHKKHPNGYWLMWYTPEGRFFANSFPSLDLNNIFKYAIPKLQNEGYQIDIVCLEQKGFDVMVWDVIHDNGKEGSCKDDDLPLALFGAIWEVIK